jgi:hypothetical protein
MKIYLSVRDEEFELLCPMEGEDNITNLVWSGDKIAHQ